MSILWVMPNYAAPSEAWMDRLLEAVAPELKAIACNDAPESFWRGRVPVVRLAAPPSLPERGLRKLGWSFPSAGMRRLGRLLRDPALATVVVHYCDYAVQYMELLRACGKRIFVFCHGIDVTWDMRRWDTAEAYHPAGYGDCVRELARLPHLRFVANSRNTCGRLSAIGVPEDRVTLRYFGSPDAGVVSERSAEGPVRILYAGRLVDAKGPDLVIQAFERLCALGVDARLTMVGDGYLQPFCRLLRERSPFRERIQLVGAASAARVQEELRRADVFTMHSQRGPLTNQEEAFGVCFLEAMAAGLPVVTGRSGGVDEIVVDGETGILFASGDVAAHTAALQRLCSDGAERRRLGEAGLARARACFPAAQDGPVLRNLLHGR